MIELFLIAQVAGRGVAIEGSLVDSVVDIGAITPVPRTVSAVRGLAALRSRVVTVIDTRAALGLDPTAVARRAVVALIDGHHYAFLVDALEDIAPHARLASISGATLGRGWGGDAGLIERDGEALPIIDLAALVPGGLAEAA